MMICALEESCRHVDVLYKLTSLPLDMFEVLDRNSAPLLLRQTGRAFQATDGPA